MAIVRTSTSGVIYPQGIEAKLFCEVEGSPMGGEYITWYKESTNVGELGDRYSTYFSNKTSFLRIKHPNQRDVGVYRCNANNGISNVTSEAILFITNCKHKIQWNGVKWHFKYYFKTVIALFAVKPEMENSPLTKKAAVNNGANAQLFCKAKGSPLPHFTWMFNGKTILPNVTDYKYGLTYTNASISTLNNQNINCTM